MNPESAEGLSAILEPSFPRETACFNREGFQFFLAREVAEANRYGYFSAFALFQVESGNNGAYLKRLVETLSRNIRATDYLGVLDESTVGVIFQHATVDSARRVLNRLRGELSLVFVAHNGGSLKEACTVFPTEANTLESLKSLVEERLRA